MSHTIIETAKLIAAADEVAAHFHKTFPEYRISDYFFWNTVVPAVYATTAEYALGAMIISCEKSEDNMMKVLNEFDKRIRSYMDANGGTPYPYVYQGIRG